LEIIKKASYRLDELKLIKNSTAGRIWYLTLGGTPTFIGFYKALASYYLIILLSYYPIILLYYIVLYIFLFGKG
jgi:hypothetical protein